MESTFFKVEIDSAVAHLILAKPEKANAMSPDFWEDLPRLTKELGNNPEIRAMVISAEGRHFTSGMDLSAFNNILDQGTEPARAAYDLRKTILHLQDTFTALEEAPFAVIIATHGVCLGGGIDMITAADIRLASADCSFGIEEINIGMAADVGTLQRLPKLIGFGAAMELAMTGRRFSAAEAKELGLVNHVYETREALLDAAMDLARQIAAKSPLAITGIKRSLTYARDHSVSEGLEQIANWNSGMLRAEDLMEAMQARMAKRDAEFRDLSMRAEKKTA